MQHINKIFGYLDKPRNFRSSLSSFNKIKQIENNLNIKKWSVYIFGKLFNSNATGSYKKHNIKFIDYVDK